MSLKRLTDSSISTGNKFGSANMDYPYSLAFISGYDDYSGTNPLTVTLQNGDIVIANAAGSYQWGTVSRINVNTGTTLWSKIFSTRTPAGFASIAKDSSDFVYLLAGDGSIYKINSSNGTISWQSKESRVGSFIAVNGSYLYLVGQANDLGNTNYDMTLIVLNTSNGSQVSTRYLRHPSGNLTLYGGRFAATSSYVFTHASTASAVSGYGGSANQFMRTNSTGGSATGYLVGSTTLTSQGNAIASDSSNNIYLGAYGSYKFMVTKIPDSMSSITFSKQYTVNSNTSLETRSIFHSNGFVYVTGRHDRGGYEHHFVAQINATTGALVKAIYLDGYYTQNFYNASIDSTNIYFGAEFWDGSGSGILDQFGFLVINQDLSKNIGNSLTFLGVTRTWVDATADFTTSDTGFSINTPGYTNNTFSSTTTTPTNSFINNGSRYTRVVM